MGARDDNFRRRDGRRCGKRRLLVFARQGLSIGMLAGTERGISRKPDEGS